LVAGDARQGAPLPEGSVNATNFTTIALSRRRENYRGKGAPAFRRLSDARIAAAFSVLFRDFSAKTAVNSPFLRFSLGV
jgi:hypothetical protein